MPRVGHWCPLRVMLGASHAPCADTEVCVPCTEASGVVDPIIEAMVHLSHLGSPIERATLVLRVSIKENCYARNHDSAYQSRYQQEIPIHRPQKHNHRIGAGGWMDHP